MDGATEDGGTEDGGREEENLDAAAAAPAVTVGGIVTECVADTTKHSPGSGGRGDDGHKMAGGYGGGGGGPAVKGTMGPRRPAIPPSGEARGLTPSNTNLVP